MTETMHFFCVWKSIRHHMYLPYIYCFIAVSITYRLDHTINQSDLSNRRDGEGETFSFFWHQFFRNRKYLDLRLLFLIQAVCDGFIVNWRHSDLLATQTHKNCTANLMDSIYVNWWFSIDCKCVFRSTCVRFESVTKYSVA